MRADITWFPYENASCLAASALETWVTNQQYFYIHTIDGIKHTRFHNRSKNALFSRHTVVLFSMAPLRIGKRGMFSHA